jgi:hypothetical protein
MPTPFEAANKAFTDTAHRAAMRIIYPKLYNCAPDELEEDTDTFENSERGRLLDGEMAIDYVIKAPSPYTTPKTGQKLAHYVQERFRRPRFSDFNDVTVTEWNWLTDKPSELYKLRAPTFLYGYYDEATDDFPKVWALSVAHMMISMHRDVWNNNLTRRMNKKSQSFLPFKIGILIEKKAVLWRYQAADHAAKGGAA